MKNLLSPLLVLGLVMGCQPQVSSTSKQGAMTLKIQWPQLTSSSQFRIQEIPPEATSIKVIVEGEGLNSPRENTLTRQSGENKVVLTLPAGPKKITIQAFDANGKLVAEATQEATIKVGQVVRASMDLQVVIEPEPSPSASTQAPPPSTGGGGSSGSPPSGGSAPIGGGGQQPGGGTPPGGGNSPPGDGGAPPPGGQTPGGTPPGGNTNTQSGLLTSTGGGGGGGSTSGGGSTGSTSGLTGITVDTVTATPDTLPGMGYPTELKATVSNPGALTDTNYQWSCDEGLGQFNRTDSARVIWTAPTTPPAGNSPHTFTLRVRIVDGNGVTVSEGTVTVTAPSGSGSVTNGSGNVSNGGGA